MAGEDDDGGGAEGLNFFGSGESVEAGHGDIEDGDIGLLFTNKADGFVSIGGFGDDLIASLGEHCAQHLANKKFVFCDDDA